MSTKSEITKGLPAWAKGIIAVTIVGLAAGATIITYKTLKNFSLRRDEGQVSIDKYEKELDKKKLSFPISQYSTTADILFTAMDGAGTDYIKIKTAIFSLKNFDDWAMLNSVFGNRKNTSGWYSNDFKGNLVEWLSDELDDSQTAEISAKLKTIGVNF